MGEVYRARDTRLGREVAVKIISFDVSSEPDRLRRFEQEARAVAALNHPSILSVYESGDAVGDGGLPVAGAGAGPGGGRAVEHGQRHPAPVLRAE